MILGPALTFNPREIPLRNKGNFTRRVFHFKDKEKEKTVKKTQEERPALMRKRGMKMDEDEEGWKISMRKWKLKREKHSATFIVL